MEVFWLRVEGAEVKIKGKERKERSDKKIRIGPYFPKEIYQRLNRLSRIVDLTDQELLLEMAEICLSHPNIIMHIQDKHLSKDDPFRVTPTYIDGKLIF
jgi:hypothetical protein